MATLDTTVALIIFNLPVFSSTRQEVCLTYSSDDPSLTPGSVGVHHCNPSYQECCKEGCCSISSLNNNQFLWLLLLVVAFAYWMRRYCRRYCHNGRSTGGAATGRGTIFDEDEEVGRRSHQTPTIDISAARNQPEAASSTANSHPITPPPPYDTVVLTPPNHPVRPEDRIPSYEDVMKGKLK